MDSKWGFLAMIDRLAQGDITKHEEIYEMNYIYCLNLLGMYHDKDSYVSAMNKRQEIQNRSKSH
jgi:hypothetical protein